MKIDNLGIEYTGKQTASPICRLIMRQYPEYGDFGINVYRGDSLSFIVGNIASMAGKTFKENDNGITLTKYEPFDRSLFGSNQI